MHILHLIPSLHVGVGGPARAVIDLCAALARQGHDVTVLTADAGQAPPSWQSNSGKEPRLILLPPAPLPAFTYVGEVLQHFRSLVQAHDVLHVHGIWEFANAQICRIAAKLGKPYVISVHGMLDAWSMSQGSLKKQIYLETVGRKWLHGASRIHLTVQSELIAASRFFPRDLGRVVPLLIDLSDYRQLPGPGLANALLTSLKRQPRVLFLSRLHPKKGLETLLDAARLLAARGRGISLVIAGDGDPAYVAQLKANAHDLDNVAFLGMVNGTLKLSLYQACDVFALPTRQENFGLVFVEALGCGLPVITTADVGSRAELEGSGAVSFVERTPEQFAAAIENLLIDSERAARIGRRGREWVLESFDPVASVQRFESFYGEVLADAAIADPLSA